MIVSRTPTPSMIVYISFVYISLFLVFCEADDNDDSFLRRSSKPGLRDVGEYCASYHQNYIYYCRGIWTAEKLHEHRGIMKNIGKFCPSYKAACVTRTRVDANENKAKRAEHRKYLAEDVGDMSFDHLIRKLEKIVPCRPNCNAAVHPHCTLQCKCEYEYHRMQKWCKPARIEERFKYFCRIWYMSCYIHIKELDPQMTKALESQFFNYGNY